jgi:ketosteroid isomerase-like protein
MNTAHPNALLLEKLYADFARGDIPAFLAACADPVTFQIAGKSKLAGKYTKADFASKFVAQLQELSGGTLRIETHDILASDRHGIVLATDHLVRAGKPVEFRTVHVWRFEGGKPVAWYEYPRDLYAYDQIWS